MDLADASASDNDDIKAGYVWFRIVISINAERDLPRSPPTECAIMTASVVEDKADALLKRDYSATDIPKLR